jgi:hypothetical protein
METTALIIIAVRIAYECSELQLRCLWRQALGFANQPTTTTATFRRIVGIPVIAASRRVGLVPDVVGEFIDRAAIQTASWMIRQERVGIPIFHIASAGVDVGRHELLRLLQDHLAKLNGPGSAADNLCKLLQRLDGFGSQLTDNARRACRRARQQTRTWPYAEDVAAIAGGISAAARYLPVDAGKVAYDMIEMAYERCYELGSAKFNRDEFDLPNGYLPSVFVADVTCCQLRHTVMSFVENTY